MSCMCIAQLAALAQRLKNLPLAMLMDLLGPLQSAAAGATRLSLAATAAANASASASAAASANLSLSASAVANLEVLCNYRRVLACPRLAPAPWPA